MANHDLNGLQYDLDMALKGYNFPFLGAYVPQYNYCWFIKSSNAQLEEILHYRIISQTPAAVLPVLREIGDPLALGPIVGVEEYRDLVEAITLAYTMIDSSPVSMLLALSESDLIITLEHNYTQKEKDLATKLLQIVKKIEGPEALPHSAQTDFYFTWLSNILLNSFPYPQGKVNAYSMFYNLAYEEALQLIEDELDKDNKDWFDKMWENFYIPADPHDRLRISLLILKWMHFRNFFLSQDIKELFKYISPLINSFYHSFIPSLIINTHTNKIEVDMSRDKFILQEQFSFIYDIDINIHELIKFYPGCVCCKNLAILREYFYNDKKSVNTYLKKELEYILEVIESLRKGTSCQRCQKIIRIHFNSNELLSYEIMIKELIGALDSYILWLEAYLETIGQGLLAHFQIKEKEFRDTN